MMPCRTQKKKRWTVPVDEALGNHLLANYGELLGPLDYRAGRKKAVEKSYVLAPKVLAEFKAKLPTLHVKLGSKTWKPKASCQELYDLVIKNTRRKTRRS